MNQFAPLRLAACLLVLFWAMPSVAQVKGVRSLKQGQKTGQAMDAVQKTQRSTAELQRNVDKTVRLARHYHRQMPRRIPEAKIQQLLNLNPNPSKILTPLWEMQNKYGNFNLFGKLAMRFYMHNFGLVTPHLQKLFTKISRLNDHAVQNQFINRMIFLAENQDHILKNIIPHKIPRANIRMRYTQDADKITAANFDPQKLILSVEQHMNPNPEKDFPIRHVNAQSVFATPGGQYAVYQYAGPADLISSLYRYLLNGSGRREPFILVFDEEAQSLAMYNKDKTRWLRVTPHEYENPSKLHIHLNELRSVPFTNAQGRQTVTAVNINLSIPLLPPDNLPSHPTSAQRFLYEKLVLHPVKNMQGDKHVTIERRSIF